MNDDFLEKLSALVDGELNDFEIRQFLRQLDQASEEERSAIYQRWQRYQLTNSAVRSTLKHAAVTSNFEASQSFVDAVSEAIGTDVPDDVVLDSAEDDQQDIAGFQPQALHSVEEESAKHADAAQVAVAELKPTADSMPLLSRFAVAASVALAVVVGVQQYQMGEQQERILAAGANVQQVDQTQVTLLAELQSAQSEEEQLAAQDRLMDYLQRRRAESLGASPVDPYARVATFADESE